MDVKFQKEEEPDIPEEELGETPEEFLCPITLMLMKDPVTTVCGHTFERKAIQEWFQGRTTCPSDNVRLSTKYLTPNHTLRQVIESYVLQRPILAIEAQVKTDFALAVRLREEALRQKLRQDEDPSLALQALLRNLGLEQYQSALFEDGFDTLERCAQLEMSDLMEEEIKMKKGHAKQFLRAVQPEKKKQEKKREKKRDSECPIKSNEWLENSLVQLKNFKSATGLNGRNAVLEDYEVDRKMFLIRMDGKRFPIQRRNFKIHLIPDWINTDIGHFPRSHLELASRFPVAVTTPREVGFEFTPEEDSQTLVFLGPTGAGKSRLINFLLGKNMFVSQSSLSSVTRKIDALTVRRVAGRETRQYNLVDTVGLQDTVLSNREVLEIAEQGVKKGFRHLNRFVLVLRNGRLTRPEEEAIQQLIDHFNLDDKHRKESVIVIITHCDALSDEENKCVVDRYKEHKVIGKLFTNLSFEQKSTTSTGLERKYTFGNFFCVGLPDLEVMDPDLQPIFLRRLVIQRRALVSLLFAYNLNPIPVTHVPSFLQNLCTIL